MRTIIFFFLTILYSLKGFTQDGPGGFGTTDGTSNVVLWLDANTINQTNTSNVSTWSDNSGFSNDASNTTVSEQPSFQTNIMNGYPTVRYATDDFLTAADNNSLDPNEISYFVVANYTDVTGTADDFAQFVYKSDFNLEEDGYGVYRNGGTSDFVLFAGANSTSNFNFETITNNTNTMVYMRYNNSGGNNLQTRIDESGANNTNTSNDNISSNNDDLYIGGFLNGEIAEVIIVDAVMRSAERKIVANYLSAKYNITINSSRDYYTMDDTLNGDFDHNVAGIGREGGSNRIEEAKGTGIVLIDNPSSLDDDDYLFWGENVKDATYNFNTTANYEERLNTTWRVSEVNNVGTVDVSVNAADINFISASGCNNLTLVVSSSSTFATKTTYTMTLASGVYQATGVTLNDADYFTFEYIDQVVLDGTTFFNGSGAANAPDTTDSCYKFLIKNNVTGATALTANAHVREVEVETGGNLAVTTGNYLEIENGIQLDGDIRLVGNAQLIQNHTGTEQVSGTGSLYIDQASNIASANSIYRYTYWSSPVKDADGDTTFSVEDIMKDGTTATSALGGASEAQNINFISYDGSIASVNGSTSNPITIANHWINTYKEGTDNSGFTQQLETGNISLGLGYLMKGSGRATGQNFTFVGTPNDGNIDVNISSSGTSTILGNPYPSAIDADQFMLDNSSVIRQEIYFWQHQGEVSTSEGHNQSSYYGGYTVLNRLTGVGAVQPGTNSAGTGSFTYDPPGDYIPVGQGFLVIADGTGDITFQNSQRAYQALRGDSPSGSSFFFGRGSNANRENDTPILRLGFEHNNQFGIDLHRQIVVGFKDGLTFGFESGFDTRMIDSRLTEVFWNFPSDENRYIITGIQEFNKDIEIPLSLTIGEEKPVHFMIDEKKNIDEDVFLKDELTGEFFNLSETVELNLPIGNYTDRFFITFKKQEVLNTDTITPKNVTVFKDEFTQELVIKTQDSTFLKEVKIYNILGQETLVYKNLTTNTTQRLSLPKIATGTYILRIKTDKGILSKKVIIH